MRDLLSPFGNVLVWVLFFATTVYGHVALKLAVEARRGLLAAALSLWGLSAFAAWMLSAVLWMVVLAKHSLFQANTISALRHALVCLAAWAIWRSELSARNVVGVAAITAGVYLVVR